MRWGTGAAGAGAGGCAAGAGGAAWAGGDSSGACGGAGGAGKGAGGKAGAGGKYPPVATLSSSSPSERPEASPSSSENTMSCNR